MRKGARERVQARQGAKKPAPAQKAPVVRQKKLTKKPLPKQKGGVADELVIEQLDAEPAESAQQREAQSESLSLDRQQERQALHAQVPQPQQDVSIEVRQETEPDDKPPRGQPVPALDANALPASGARQYLKIEVQSGGSVSGSEREIASQREGNDQQALLRRPPQHSNFAQPRPQSIFQITQQVEDYSQLDLESNAGLTQQAPLSQQALDFPDSTAHAN